MSNTPHEWLFLFLKHPNMLDFEGKWPLLFEFDQQAERADVAGIEGIGTHLAPKARRHKVTPAQAHLMPFIPWGDKRGLVDD